MKENFKGRIVQYAKSWSNDALGTSFEIYERDLMELTQEAYALGKKEVLDGIKNGTICSSCGEPMEQGLSEWCGQCLENN